MKKLIAALAVVASLAALTPETASAQAAGVSKVPVVSSCGGAAASVVADGYSDLTHSELWGEITTGSTASTTCTVTFPAPFQKATYCVLHDRTLVANLTSYTLTNAAFVLTLASSSSQHIDYFCVGY